MLMKKLQEMTLSVLFLLNIRRPRLSLRRCPILSLQTLKLRERIHIPWNFQRLRAKRFYMDQGRQVILHLLLLRQSLRNSLWQLNQPKILVCPIIKQKMNLVKIRFQLSLIIHLGQGMLLHQKILFLTVQELKLVVQNVARSFLFLLPWIHRLL